ncbi:LuxR family transcriptional activator of conjugal transfer of Ti plasmids [Bradyrhizobium japonicum]|uniref:helix-turn-helix transcriptional regulator n=1 Tax=Bradyrhizobium diazoefficiens TaxID=1355477 RepID=UPI00349777F6
MRTTKPVALFQKMHNALQMSHTFQRYVDGLMECHEEGQLRQSMADTAAALDLFCFAYLALPRPHAAAPVLISNYPTAWTSHYMAMEYQRSDPVIIQALREPSPFEWGNGVGPRRKSPLARQLFEEAAGFGIRCGFTIPVHDSAGAIAAVTFAADTPRPSFKRAIDKHADVLQLMAMCFHAHASRQLTSKRNVEGVLLSPRELECLKWAAEGKSAWETGRIMEISRHTVAFHLENAKAKLGVRSTVQAVARVARANPQV